MKTLLVILILYFASLVHPRRQKNLIFLDTLHLFLWEYQKICRNFGHLLHTPHLFGMQYLKFGGASPHRNGRKCIRNKWGVYKKYSKFPQILDTPTEIGGKYPQISNVSVYWALGTSKQSQVLEGPRIPNSDD